MDICSPCNMQPGIAWGDLLRMQQELGILDESFHPRTPSQPHYVRHRSKAEGEISYNDGRDCIRQLDKYSLKNP